MAFTAIVQAPGLGPAGRKLAADAGPAEVLVRTSYPSLLRTAGFVDVVADDVTADYRATLERWFVATEQRRDDVVAAVGDDDVDDRQARRTAAMAAVDDGVLTRWRFVAHRPT
jgi:hypothetical protein